jgi:hypothetical protein
MAVKINKVDVWVAQMADRPGALAQKLETVADAGANLEFMIARRAPDKPGRGVVFMAPLRGARQLAAARKAGLKKAKTMHSLRLVSPDRPGIGAKMTRALGEAGINVRGVSAAALSRRSVTYFAFDTDADAKKAARVVRKALGGR